MDADSDVALDILITNVVCVFRTRCHLNLRKIALEGANVIYKRDVGKVLMKLRKPRITATIWSSGKIICTGATSEEEAIFGARRLARSLQKLGFQVIFTDCKVVNVLAVCNMPFEIRLPEFTKNNRPHASYEPELHPAVCYRIKSLLFFHGYSVSSRPFGFYFKPCCNIKRKFTRHDVSAFTKRHLYLFSQ